MSSATTHLLEQELSDKRARLSDTIDRIQDRLTVSGIVDEVMGQAGVPRLASGHDYVLGILRKNPLPVMIVAAGVGWYLYRRGKLATPLTSADVAPGIVDVPVLNHGQARRYDPDREARHPDADAAATGPAGPMTRA